MLSIRAYAHLFALSVSENTLVYSIIREALGLREDGGCSGSAEVIASIKANVILEAEMVAFSDALNKIDGKFH